MIFTLQRWKGVREESAGISNKEKLQCRDPEHPRLTGVCELLQAQEIFT